MFWNVLRPQEATTSVCMFKNATGVACPSCGSTRALMSIAKGDFTQALMTNPIGYIGFAVMLIVPVLLMVGTLRKKNLVSDFFLKTESLIRQPRWAIPLVALLVVNWVWNIYKGL
jgi:hypothetical protein